MDDEDDERFLCWRDPRLKQNWKTVTAALLLLLAGIGLLVMGILCEAINLGGVRSVVFFVLSAICLIPGAYMTVYIVRALRGEKGFEFRSMPSYDDD